MDIVLYVAAGILIVGGLCCAIMPALPGIPLIFGGIWLIAGTDHYRHLGLWWLITIAAVGFVGLTVDLLAGSWGAKRVAASPLAMWGALAGTLIGFFLGIPGILFGPFVGAMLGELISGNSVLRATHVGIGTWVGLIFGTLAKWLACMMMVALFVAAWWWNAAFSLSNR